LTANAAPLEWPPVWPRIYGDLQGDEAGQIAEDVVDALERAAMGCGNAITACKEAMQG